MKLRMLPFLLPLATLSGCLLSGASWAGRTGINLAYREYRFLNVWWQAALVVLTVWLALYFLQKLRPLRFRGKESTAYYAVATVVCLAGFGLTVADFHNTASHRLLGAKFHWGAYLFFIGWLLILGEGWIRRQPKTAVA